MTFLGNKNRENSFKLVETIHILINFHEMRSGDSLYILYKVSH